MSKRESEYEETIKQLLEKISEQQSSQNKNDIRLADSDAHNLELCKFKSLIDESLANSKAMLEEFERMHVEKCRLQKQLESEQTVNGVIYVPSVFAASYDAQD